jgi:hypothetical protein
MYVAVGASCTGRKCDKYFLNERKENSTLDEVVAIGYGSVKKSGWQKIACLES